MIEDENMAGQAGSEPARTVGPREIHVFQKNGRNVSDRDFRGRRDSDPKAPATSATESVKDSKSKTQKVPALLPSKDNPASAEKVLPPPPAPAPSSTDKTSTGKPELPAALAIVPQE